MNRTSVAAAMTSALLFAALPAAAQQAVPMDTIIGRVIDSDSTPIAGARVSAALDSSRVFRTLSDSAGRYRLAVPGGERFYHVTAEAFGYVPFAAVVIRPPDGKPMERELRLNARVVTLDTLEVRARKVKVREKSTPGEEGEAWSSLTTENYPVQPGELADVAALTPGVTRVGGDAFSFAGQPPDQNRITVDGASYGGGSLPSEGVQKTAVVGSTFDVSRGGFSGGLIAATTISGTNHWGGALSARLDDPNLQYGSLPGAAGQQDRALRLGAGGGGALVRDRLFVYGAADLSHRSGPGAFLDPGDAGTLRLLGVAADSVRRFAQVVNALGLPSGGPAPDAGSDFGSALARIDYALSDHHSLMARLNWRGSRASGLGASPLRLPGSDGEQRSTDAGVLAALTSGWGLWANELHLYRSAGHAGADLGLELPHGVVRVTSALDEGAAGVSALDFGGLPSFFPDEEHSLSELSDDLVRETQDGAHRIKAGVLVREVRSSVEGVQNRAGTFIFNSLGALEQGRAASFTRTLAGPQGDAVRREGALYLGDRWKPSDDFALIYGLRLEGSRYGERPPLSSVADSLLGALRSRPPANLFLSPRIGFAYTVSRWVGLRGGIGAFRGTADLRSLASVWNEVGAGNSELTCVGPAAPVPDWSAYAAGTAPIPTTCAGGAELFADRAPAVTLFGPGFAPPRTWHASLTAGGMVTSNGLLTYYLNGLLVRGTHLPTAVDRNLVAAPAFTLAGEDGRPVYVEPGAIDPLTGGISAEASRRVPSLGAVREIGSRGESWTGQFTAGLGGFVGTNPQLILGLSYTLTRSRTFGGGFPVPGGSSASTAGDPARLEWAPGDYERRHAFQASLTGSLGRWVPWLRIGAIGRLQSGSPFTALVAEDVNGDGFANDRAFVFDPAASADPEIAGGMKRLLNDAPPSVRDCLRAAIGRVAGRNACRTGWSPSLDVLATIFASGRHNSRRLRIDITASNVTAGLDYLLHGPDDLHGWGQYPLPDAALLEVRGFDPERRTFRYAVNPRFGQPLGGGIFRMPFRLTLQARLTLGEDPRYQPILRMVEQGMGLSPASIRPQIAERVRNVPAVVLALSVDDPGALELTRAQKARLQTAADSLGLRREAAIDALVQEFTKRGAQTAARRAKFQDRVLAARGVWEAGVRAVKRVLTPEQWARLPLWLTRPPDVTNIGKSPTFTVKMPSDDF